ncbi:thioesterase family protein [soil metagenome]
MSPASDLDTSKAFYEPDGDHFVATKHTRGPWDPDAQHAGPPSALLGREIERMPTRDGVPMRVARITYEIVRPVPIERLRVQTRVVRPGRRVELDEAILLDESGQELVRASAWRIRVEPIEIPGDTPFAEHKAIAGPEAGVDNDFFPTGHEFGYHSAMEMSFLRGAFLERGSALVWMRMRHPLVAGEGPSQLQRVLIAADTGNGVSSVLDWRKYLFINVELSVHLQRYPRGEWVCLDAVTEVESDGIGRSDTVISDREGPIARASQALLIDGRP